jgi:YD repeat-containing protein
LLVVHIDALQRRTTYVYDRDRDGRTHGDLVEIDYPDGTSKSYVYEPRYHQLSVARDELRQPTSYEYNAQGDLTTLTNARGEVTTYAYYPAGPWAGLVQSMTTAPQGSTDPNQHLTRYQYDSHRCLQRSTDALAEPTRYGYDFFGNPAWVRDALGRVNATTYDGRNQLVATRDALGGQSTWRYAASGLLLRHEEPLAQPTDPSGQVTRNSYDQRGLLQETLVGWDPSRLRPAGVADVSVRTTYGYDVAGRWQFQTTGLAQPGAPANYAKAATTAYGYDELNRPTQIDAGWDPATGLYLQETRIGYDLVGNVLSRTTGLASDPTLAHPATTRYLYDQRDRPTAVYQGVQAWSLAGYSFWLYDRLTTTKYNPVGNVSATTTGWTTNFLGLLSHPGTTTYAYDVLNRVTDLTEAAGTPAQRRTHTEYDGAGNVLSVTTGLADDPGYAHPSTTSYAYDALNRRVASYEGWHRYLGQEALTFYERATTLAYDAVGNVLSVTSGLARPDWLADPLVLLFPELNHPSITSYVYDALNRPTFIAEDWGQRVVTLPWGGTVVVPTYSRGTAIDYDGAGNVQSRSTGWSVNLPSQVSTSRYGYDILNRLTDTTEAADTPQQRHSHRDYDAANNLVGLRTGEGGPKAPPGYSHVVQNRYEYDLLHRQTRSAQAVGDANAQQTTTMIYDAADNLLSVWHLPTPLTL